ncbi:MAG: FkbM family methyltransferase [Patescibacteria group bacterium]
MTKFHVKNVNIIIPGIWFGYAGEIYASNVYFPNKDFLIKDGDTVLDLGASGGVFTILAAKLGGRVMAVEPNRHALDLLIQNAKLNNCLDKIIPIWGLVGGTTGDMSNKKILENLRHKGVLPPHLVIEELRNEHKIDRFQFVKIDIEGSESDLFRNLEWLDCVDKIAMELHLPYCDPSLIKKSLESKKFEVVYKEYNNESGYLYAKSR